MSQPLPAPHALHEELQELERLALALERHALRRELNPFMLDDHGARVARRLLLDVGRFHTRLSLNPWDASSLLRTFAPLRTEVLRLVEAPVGVHASRG